MEGMRKVEILVGTNRDGKNRKARIRIETDGIREVGSGTEMEMTRREVPGIETDMPRNEQIRLRREGFEWN